MEECSISSLDEKEIYYIQLYNSYEYGYNMNIGGSGFSAGEKNPHSKLTENEVKEIKQTLKNTNEYISKISSKYGVSSGTIHCINTGATWSHVGNYTYPLRKVREINMINTCLDCDTLILNTSVRCIECNNKYMRNENHSQSKHSNIEILEIKNMLKESSLSMVDISKIFNTTSDVITSINLGKTWSTLGNFQYPIRDNGFEINECEYCGASIKKEHKKCKSCYLHSIKGEGHPNLKITDDQVLEIKELIKENLKYFSEISKMYNVSTTTIKNINNGISRQDVGNYDYPIRDNRVDINLCKKCGKSIKRPAKLCIKCYGETKRKHDRPGRDELWTLLYYTPNITQVAKDLGVSRGAVVYWLETYSLPKSDTEILSYIESVENKRVSIYE